MKTHKTVRLTMKHLEAVGACDLGKTRVARYLATPISSDHEANIDLAIRLIQERNDEFDDEYGHTCDVQGPTQALWLWESMYHVDCIYAQHCPNQLAVVLADIADHILTARGQ